MDSLSSVIANIESFQLKQISFADLVKYWKDTDHFRDPNKVYTEVLSRLGHFECEYSNPRRKSYGLFDGDAMIGATHLTQWNREWLRVRTINVAHTHRGRELGWKMLLSALNADWVGPYESAGASKVFGWFRLTAYAWATSHGFREVDGVWEDDHVGMLIDLPSTRAN